MGGVLVVENDIFVQKTVRRVLALHKVPVETTDDPEDGLKKISIVKPKVILMGIFLSKMNGFELLKKLKEDEETKNIPVIALINFSEEELVKKAKDLGAVDCLVKSEFTPDEIVDKVKPYL
ncbi:TPA: hypothetical protein DD455_03670 [Candidatus Shapirobacteria bacterium]|nr:hypothetical protein [Candidatus Shapirobacteria bacterium]